ncbi:MAG: hypothetical protein M0P61_03455 [Ignavibacteriaceae bacterium]|jgi:hypothetical protein|nr:hypothetical protein [Ignavibacteriaceae bacterium]
MLFSERKGLKTSKLIQLDYVDDDLRFALWDSVYTQIFLKVEYYQDYNSMFARIPRLSNSNLGKLFEEYWHSLLKRPIDNLPDRMDSAVKIIREYFFECTWNNVYDFIEFTACNCPDSFLSNFLKYCNKVLERENSAYRFVNYHITEVTSQVEIDSIEEALKKSSHYYGVQTHLNSALTLLSDRKNPDYRNSIKESISAVESLAKKIVGNDKTTLGDALKIFEDKNQMHPAFKKSLSTLYGYTSDANGIRHAILEESNLSVSDAKFMLIACSAFINYIIGKSSEV